MFIPKHKAFIVLLLIFSTFSPVDFIVYAGESENDAGTTKESKLYNITIRGTVSGWSFTRSGILTLSPTVSNAISTNGINPKEVTIISGNPITNPDRGAIQFSTNNYFLNGAHYIDTAYVSLSGGCCNIKVDSKQETFLSSLNFFTVSSGFTALPYQIYSGTINGCVDRKSKKISGNIDLRGEVPPFSGMRSTYKASFTGQFAGTGNFDNMIATSETDGFTNVVVMLKLDASFVNNPRKSFCRREIRKLQNAVLEKLNPDDVVAAKRLKYAPTILLRIKENALQALGTFPEVSEITTTSSTFKIPQ